MLPQCMLVPANDTEAREDDAVLSRGTGKCACARTRLTPPRPPRQRYPRDHARPQYQHQKQRQRRQHQPTTQCARPLDLLSQP